MPPVDVPTVAGNAPPKVKEFVARAQDWYAGRGGKDFGDVIGARLRVAEVSLNPKADEPSRAEMRVVYETRVEQDMVNGAGSMHGGCAAYLIDICSTMALFAYDVSQGVNRPRTVSLSLDVVYHAPAPLGEDIRIINTSMTVGGRVMSARTEIWSITGHRLVASGVHIKMAPSEPKPKL